MQLFTIFGNVLGLIHKIWEKFQVKIQFESFRVKT